MKSRSYLRKTMKAPRIDRVKLTQEKMAAGKKIKKTKTAREIFLEAKNEKLSPELIVAKENSPFLKQRGDIGTQKCPDCGSEMERWESCWRCPNCGNSLC